jgi:hypothetical protein
MHPSITRPSRRAKNRSGLRDGMLPNCGSCVAYTFGISILLSVAWSEDLVLSSQHNHFALVAQANGGRDPSGRPTVLAQPTVKFRQVLATEKHFIVIGARTRKHQCGCQSTRMAPGSSFPAGPNRMSFMRSLSGNPPIPTILLFLSADLQGPSRLLTQLLRKLREIDYHSCLGRFELQRCIWSEQTYELNSSDISQSYTVTGPVR